MASKSRWVCDFETTTEADLKQDGYVRVFLWHARDIYSDEECMGYDVDTFINFAWTVNEIWFHNLKFDGSYILNRILELGWERSDKQIKGKCTYDLIVTDLGAWMQLELKFGDHVTRIRDSAKKFPGFALEDIAKIYGIEGKSDLYLGYRGPDYTVTEEDKERVKGDTRILKVAMRHLFDTGMSKMTMSGDAMESYRQMIGKNQYSKWFPFITSEMDAFIREAYRGGWTFVNPRWQMQDIEDVDVYDVNSMYPSVMRDCPLPCGMPYRRREPLPGELWIVKFTAKFRCRDDRFPMLQRKNSVRFAEAEYVYESDGIEELTLTCVDYDLFKEHYIVEYEGKHEYVCFQARQGMFEKYVAHWGAEKVRCSKAHDDAGKATAKRMLNSLYGRFGMKQDRMSKVPYLEDGVIKWNTETSHSDGAYLPVACFITAWARKKILDMAERWADCFVYADTDSVHVVKYAYAKKRLNPLDGEVREPRTEGMDIDDARLGAWKLESTSEMARYVRPKAYIHAKKDGTLEDVKCAGMPDKCKAGVTWQNFLPGARYEGKLTGAQVKGGYCLIETSYVLKVEDYERGRGHLVFGGTRHEPRRDAELSDRSQGLREDLRVQEEDAGMRGAVHLVETVQAGDHEAEAHVLCRSGEGGAAARRGLEGEGERDHEREGGEGMVRGVEHVGFGEERIVRRGAVHRVR